MSLVKTKLDLSGILGTGLFDKALPAFTRNEFCSESFSSPAVRRGQELEVSDEKEQDTFYHSRTKNDKKNR